MKVVSINKEKFIHVRDEDGFEVFISLKNRVDNLKRTDCCTKCGSIIISKKKYSVCPICGNEHLCHVNWED